jgi:hypothetical protein
MLTPNTPAPATINNRFIDAIRLQLQGLEAKVLNELSEKNFDKEFLNLQNDIVYRKFSFDRIEYVLIRFMGRISISIGRRLGEIYDKVPRILAAVRFNLTSSQVYQKVNDLELDLCFKFSDLAEADILHVRNLLSTRTSGVIDQGLGIEIRYNFNPNDSSRLRKDEEMGQNLIAAGLTPIYLVFSDISPRADAMQRLRRSGWTFLIGEEASTFINELVGVDFQAILDEPTIKAEISLVIDDIMSKLVNSHAFQEVVKKYSTTSSSVL